MGGAQLKLHYVDVIATDVAALTLAEGFGKSRSMESMKLLWSSADPYETLKKIGESVCKSKTMPGKKLD